ncbi:MAG: GlxA family transcriptional regulator [Gammaproteobacteria bacterium]
MNLVFVLTNNMLAASSMLPIEMWRAAEQTRIATKSVGEALNLVTVSRNEEAVSTQAGIELLPTSSLACVTQADVVYMPALWRNPRPTLRENKTLLPWLQGLFEGGCLLAAVGTGCCFLAEAGLLDGKSATTHWHYLDQFQADYPRVLLKRDYFITQSGSIFCAASVNALADVTVYLIERFYGREIALHVERNFSHEIRRPYDKYRYFDGDDLQHSDELIVEVQLWMKRHLADTIPMSDIARRFGLSQRSLNRRFRQAIGLSPLDYLQGIRVDAAKELLHTTNLTVAEVSFRVGYQDQGHFNRIFQRQMVVTPSEYRKTVRAKVFSGNA